MKTFLHRAAFLIAGSAFMTATANAGTSANLTIQVNKPGIAISPSLYGFMTEEINHSYDGGLYAELIRNRSFQDDPQPGALVFDPTERRPRDNAA